jgi:hypothetical protein
MRRYLFQSLLVLCFFSSLDLLAVSFNGRIFSRTKNKGEAAVTVFIFETKKGYTTDEEGFFDAEVPTFGEYTFRILRATGMQEINCDTFMF